MNIFEHRDSFFSGPDAESEEGSLLATFQLAKQIRLRLGKQGYLLDCYLSLFFKGAANTLAFEAADDGYLAGGEFQTIMFSLIDGTDAKKDHPLYPRMRKAYEEHSDELCFQERYTRLCQLLLPLADELLAEAAARFQEEQVHRLDGVVDEIRMRELYEQISDLAGESMMEELNRQLKQRFLIAPPTVVFMQGLTNDLLYRLADRDHETSRQMFQLFLNDMPETDGV